LIEAMQRIDAIAAIAGEIKDMTANAQPAVRQDRLNPLVACLHAWMIDQRGVCRARTQSPMRRTTSLKRWSAFARFRLAKGPTQSKARIIMGLIPTFVAIDV
jgi:hypothetical protein